MPIGAGFVRETAAAVCFCLFTVKESALHLFGGAILVVIDWNKLFRYYTPWMRIAPSGKPQEQRGVSHEAAFGTVGREAVVQVGLVGGEVAGEGAFGNVFVCDYVVGALFFDSATPPRNGL